MPYYDISVNLSAATPVWPGGYGFRRENFQALEEGFDAAVSIVHYDVHSGTHIDAPAHFVKNGKQIQDMDLERFIGACYVLNCKGLEVVDIHDLRKKHIPKDTTRLLLKTNNSDNQWYNYPFNENYVALTNEAARYLVDIGIKLIGVDGPSVQRFTDPKDTHVTFLSNDVLILEGLYLGDVEEGIYELFCPPVKIIGAEAMSVRAILKYN